MPQSHTRASNTSLDQVYIRKQAVSTLEKMFVLQELAEPGELPMHEGSQLRWTIDKNLDDSGMSVGDSAFKALTSGDAGDTDPLGYQWSDREKNADTFLTEDIETRIHTYGVYVPVRRKDLKQLVRSTMDRISKRVAYRGAEVLDTILRAVMDGSGETSVFSPKLGTGTSRIRKTAATITTTDLLETEDILLSQGDLEGTNCQPYDDGLFKLILHTGAATHVKTERAADKVNWFDGVKHVAGREGQRKFLKGHIGDIGGTDVMTSNNISIAPATTDSESYLNLHIAKEGFGNVHQDDMDPTVHINRSGPSSMSDPHRMWATVAFNFQSGPALLTTTSSPERVIVLKSATGN